VSEAMSSLGCTLLRTGSGSKHMRGKEGEKIFCEESASVKNMCSHFSRVSSYQRLAVIHRGFQMLNFGTARFGSLPCTGSITGLFRGFFSGPLAKFGTVPRSGHNVFQIILHSLISRKSMLLPTVSWSDCLGVRYP
jgi:hypothetical protein